jgi:outer membrane protein OmpA-like peptidoglycan-associated protein
MYRWQAMMMLRAGRRAFYLGFAAMCCVGGSALPAMAQSYLADNGNSVTVDYSVLGPGAGPSPVTRGALPGSALPAGSCSCANAPLGVIAAPPRPTFTNPFGTQVTQAPAVPPGFLAYSQVTGSSSSSGAVVLKAPSAPTTQMAAAPSSEEPSAEALPPTTPTANATGSTEIPPSGQAPLPATTPTQNAPGAAAIGEAAAPSGGAIPPAQPEEMPATVPSPVEQKPAEQAQAPAEQLPAAQPPAEQPPAAQPSAEQQTAEQPPAEQPPAPPQTQTAEKPEMPSATGTTTTPEQPADQQQAAVAPAAPAEGTTPPAEGGAALPAGATRILYTGESDDVPAASTAELDMIAQDMLANQEKRIQVMSYAAGTEDTESKARRKSLARGLAIRSYLIKAGVPSTRIDVRALGNKAEGGPADRVDIIPAS